MPNNAIRTDSLNHRTTGLALGGLIEDQPGTPAQLVHDGDTISVRLDGNVGLRLLGIDTPEMSFSFPGSSFLGLDNPQWVEFLTDPLNERWGAMQGSIPERLRSWLLSRVGPGAAPAHYQHAVAAKEEFRQQIQRDIMEMQATVATFRYYMNFGFEVMDGYGRLLCLLNRNQPNRDQPTRRPPTYNVRLLERGRAFPYFIWPNVNPWERPETIEEAVIPPGKARTMAENDRELKSSRAAVRDARAKHLGIFDMMNPLLLEPFELRNLSRRVAASRYLIDLNSDSDVLIHPLNYPSVPMSEDRLWIPSIYVPLFEKVGWKPQASPVM
jgi:endonuclease YncB( thermonuclease family)